MLLYLALSVLFNTPLLLLLMTKEKNNQNHPHYPINDGSKCEFLFCIIFRFISQCGDIGDRNLYVKYKNKYAVKLPGHSHRREGGGG